MDGDDKDFGDWADAKRAGKPWPPVDDGIRRRGVVVLLPDDALPGAVVELYRTADGTMAAAVRIPAPQQPSDEDRIRDAMAEATDHPGRVVTR